LDYVEAYKWFSLSVAQNFTVARHARSSVAGIMTPRQLQAAEDRIRKWQKQHPVSVASNPNEDTENLRP
ncbi:MAG TPA: hypothetical protein VGR71_04980, partial [Nitrospira sp.]|nr:hypothetical protein [Nitrospira sp.]